MSTSARSCRRCSPGARPAATCRPNSPSEGTDRTMRKLIAILLLAAAGLAHAADDSVYRAFGEKAGIQTLMKDFVVRLKADPKIGHFFKDTKTEHLVTQLTDQLCRVSGGPCVYEGAPM